MTTNEHFKHDLVRMAVHLGILRFPKNGESFPGRRGGPGKGYLVDSRGAGSNVRLRNLVTSTLIPEMLQFQGVDIIAGLSTSGIIWAAWLAQMTCLPYATILLSGPRSAGLQREIEGEVSGARVLLVDNWIGSGRSLLDAASVTTRHGGYVLGGIVVSGCSKADLPFDVRVGFSISSLLTAAAEQGLITAEQANEYIQNEK